MVKIHGMAEYMEHVRRLDAETGEPVGHKFKQDELSGLRLEGTACGRYVVFRYCSLRDIVVRNAQFVNLHVFACDIRGSVIENIPSEGTRFRQIDLYDSVFRGFHCKYRLTPPVFNNVVGCEIVDMRLNNYETEVFVNVMDSKISGVFQGVVFTENEQRTQCQGVDLSELVLESVPFFGVDMDRVVPNPAWGWAIVPEWFRYVDRLREIAAKLEKSEHDADWRAGITIDNDLDYDERGYGRPLDAQRGAKLVHGAFDRRKKPAVRERIREVYADLGVELTPPE